MTPVIVPNQLNKISKLREAMKVIRYFVFILEKRKRPSRITKEKHLVPYEIFHQINKNYQRKLEIESRMVSLLRLVSSINLSSKSSTEPGPSLARYIKSSEVACKLGPHNGVPLSTTDFCLTASTCPRIGIEACRKI